jgi:phytoene dehydrogenase-like protein
LIPARQAAVVGAGPNGLAAAITLARAGVDVTVYEAAANVGGGTRTAELTLPGFRHDVCSAVHPLAAGSPFLRSVPLGELGCDLVHPEIPLAHPLDGARVAALHRSLGETVAGLGDDGPAWQRLMAPIVERWDLLDDQLLGPVLRPPRHPFALARFGVRALRSSQALARRFETDEAKGLLAGLSGHSFLPLDRPLTGSFAVVLAALGHVHGWPFVSGGSQRLADALVSCLEALGGTIVTGHSVASLEEVSGSHRLVMADVTPTQLADLAVDRLSARQERKLTSFRHGPGVCKVDFALSEAVPWTAEQCRKAGTVHVGGRFEEIAAAEADVAAGRHAERPFVLVAQPSLFDSTRAPTGRHTLWTYCHVPNGSTRDRSEAIIAQIERFAPGFRDTILAQHTMTASQFETYDASYVGGDISAGSHAGHRLLFRPYPALDPYRTAIDGVYLCSGSTPPGGGVHGMCGYHAARAALRRSFQGR